jgi:hypothetical protein
MQLLEGVMRHALAARATFNATERMVLLQELRFQDEAARDQAAAHGSRVCAPPGVLSVGLFQAPWHNLAVKVTEAEARALFVRHGCDANGLLDYEAYAQQLLKRSRRLVGSAAKQLALSASPMALVAKPTPSVRTRLPHPCGECIACKSQGHIVYHAAALGVVYAPDTRTQRFFRGHSGAVQCVALQPGKPPVSFEDLQHLP